MAVSVPTVFRTRRGEASNASMAKTRERGQARAVVTCDNGRVRVRFGLFEFDPATGELRREGALVRLQPQPAAVLALLIQRAGEVVSRETLRDAIWGGDTFVDFDRGLNFCIAQIRGALGDAVDSPRFIRTLPKRGYQFIAPLESVESLERTG